MKQDYLVRCSGCSYNCTQIVRANNHVRAIKRAHFYCDNFGAQEGNLTACVLTRIQDTIILEANFRIKIEDQDIQTVLVPVGCHGVKFTEDKWGHYIVGQANTTVPTMNIQVTRGVKGDGVFSSMFSIADKTGMR